MEFYSFVKGDKLYSVKGKDWKEVKEQIRLIDETYDETVSHVVTRNAERLEVGALVQKETFRRIANEE